MSRAGTAADTTARTDSGDAAPLVDLIVAGAGPAGLATAIHAARAGFDTVVVEPRESPIDKACGEGLMPPAVRAVEALAGSIPGVDLTGIRYLDQHGRCAEAGFRHGVGRGVRRTVLQAALTTAARDAGVRFVQGRVDTWSQTDDEVRAAGMRARFMVAADGLHSAIRRSLGVTRVDARFPRYGLRRHFRVAPWSDAVEVHWSGAAEAYVTPVAPDTVGVAILSSTRADFSTHLSRFDALAERVSGCAGGGVRGAGPLRQSTTSRVHGRVLLVGDAAGYVDALTGEGISISLACAESLVQALATARPQDYERLWRGQTRRYRLITGALVTAARSRLLRPVIVPAATRVPLLFEAVVDQLAR